jgi:hypothetical protein
MSKLCLGKPLSLAPALIERLGRIGFVVLVDFYLVLSFWVKFNAFSLIYGDQQADNI